MKPVFGETYAGVYDALYRAKDYAREVNLIERILVQHGRGGARRILDLGCGTGSHALPLAQRGHAVTGVDRAPGMLARAADKAKKTEFPAGVAAPAFRQGDLCRLDLGQSFEAVLMMFAVLGYQYENADLLAALQSVRRHLEPGGLFIFDVWNGLAVLADRPGKRVREVADGMARIIRTTDTQLDPVHHRCRVHFHVRRIDADGSADERDEEHMMRFFFPQELDLALGCSGLRLLDLRGFPDYETEPDERAWNIVGVAQAT